MNNVVVTVRQHLSKGSPRRLFACEHTDFDEKFTLIPLEFSESNYLTFSRSKIQRWIGDREYAHNVVLFSGSRPGRGRTRVVTRRPKGVR